MSGLLDIESLKNGVDIIDIIKSLFSLLGILIFIPTSILFLRKETNVGIISTYKNTAVPNSKYIKSAIGRFLRPISGTIYMVEDLSPNYSKGNINNFIITNTSKINDLLKSNEVISLFLFGHMPIVTYLGYKFGTVKSTELYHILRPEKKSIWKWDNGLQLYSRYLHQRNWKYEITKNIIPTSNEIILNISISFPIQGENIIDSTGKSTYSVKLSNNTGYSRDNREFLRYKYQLKEFENIIKKVMYEIENTSSDVIHLFLTTPNPFSFIVGQYIHHNGPKVFIYDRDITGNYNIILTING